MSTQSEPQAGRLLRAEEAAKYLGISQRTLWGLTRDGKIAIVRPTPRAVRYLPEDIERYIASTREEAESPQAAEVPYA